MGCECVRLTAGHVICTCCLGIAESTDMSIRTLAMCILDKAARWSLFVGYLGKHRKVNDDLRAMGFLSLSLSSLISDLLPLRSLECKYHLVLPAPWAQPQEHVGLVGPRATFF